MLGDTNQPLSECQPIGTAEEGLNNDFLPQGD